MGVNITVARVFARMMINIYIYIHIMYCSTTIYCTTWLNHYISVYAENEWSFPVSLARSRILHYTIMTNFSAGHSQPHRHAHSWWKKSQSTTWRVYHGYLRSLVHNSFHQQYDCRDDYLEHLQNCFFMFLLIKISAMVIAKGWYNDDKCNYH